ncbi:MAG: bifunctional phosphoserine phosphatase/homoserine phosphotransferase ThrH [Candidatus Omnitrophica bacterium]|nr:bifunctional phosphoserine phosphatase/homoserine phosphotransferase ThrH [Candidatus Omnitrophota bacterium]
MKIVCLDMEGVLTPEIWIRVAERTGIRELRLTTRDEPDYDQLMRRRLSLLRKRGITLRRIQGIIASMRPLAGAGGFLSRLRGKVPVAVLSDTYYEFAMPLMKKLGYPVLFCNGLSTDRRGFIADYHLRQPNGKREAVLAFKRMGFRVAAAGDSYNDLAMLRAADRGVLFNPPPKIAEECRSLRTTDSYPGLLKELLR